MAGGGGEGGRVRVAVACGMGSVVSLMLEQTVRKALRDLGVDAVVERRPYDRLGEGWDVVVVPKALEAAVKHGDKVVAVSNVLSKEEVAEGLSRVLGLTRPGS